MTKEQKLKMAYEIALEHMKDTGEFPSKIQTKADVEINTFAEELEIIYNAIDKNKILNNLF